MWVASTPPFVATTSVEYVQGGYEAVHGIGDGSHGMEHGILDLSTDFRWTTGPGNY